MASAKRHNIKCPSLSNTQHSLDTFWFLLQACRYLPEVAKSGDVNSVKILVKFTNRNCTTDDQYRDTPLIYAARYGHVEVARVLLEGGVDLEKTNANQYTALHAAARRGDLEICRLLLDWGAKVDPLDKWKATPLHEAAQWGHLSVAQLLVERGADVRVKNYIGRTASDLARNNRKLETANWLNALSHDYLVTYSMVQNRC